MKPPFAVYRDYNNRMHIIDADTRIVLSDCFAYDITRADAETRMDKLVEALNSGWSVTSNAELSRERSQREALT